ncbi:putative glycosyl hydrolase [Oceaniferula spumae]|uniref:Glycosyl hydrolase n=1 Tax=Oceaniferula spumae TaxID=2979115 RepID=A0AAT9FHJ6_9BACT
MEKLPRVFEERILVASWRIIEPLLHAEKSPLKISAMRVGGEPITFDQAINREFTPFKEGDFWGSKWDTVWFHFTGEVPADWGGKPVVALVNLSFEEGEGFGREGLVYQDGKPTIAVNRNRQAIPLLDSAKGGEMIDFYVEAAANPVAQMFWGDEDLLLPEYEGEPLFRLREAKLATYNPDAFQLKMDFEVCRQAMMELPDNEPRRGQLLRALNKACDLLDLGDANCVAPAREALKEVMSKRNGDTNHQITAVGHAHIDTAWCWPLRETIRKCARTFTTMLRYMEKHPDFKFVCSQPQQYAWMKQHYPSIYADIQTAVKRGQWEIVGGMWIEADCNISSGESLVRQLIHGKNYYHEEFGIEVKDLWLPDVFGYAAALPQILRKCDIDWFLTQKISWSDTNKFPHHTFNWEGLDGTAVFTHFPPVDTYNCQLTAKELKHSEHNFQENDRATQALVPFGNGDGGGGPTLEHIELARRWEDFEGMPKVKMGSVLDFFKMAKKDAVDPPVWRGELYLELHRGTLTSQAYTKYMNRKCELLLRDAEFFQVIATQINPGDLLESDPVTDRPVWDVPAHIKEKDGDITAMAMDRAWKTLLLNQFHDIIPGSSIHWVYQDCRIDYPNVEMVAKTVRDAAVQRIVDKINVPAGTSLVFNTLAQQRNEVIELADGNLAYAEVPQCGYSAVTSSDLPANIAPVTLAESGDGFRISNGLLVIELDSRGTLTSVVDLANNREVMSGRGNLLQIHKDYPNRWNAWDVDVFYKDQVENLDDVAEIQVLEEGPLRVSLRVSRSFGESRFSQRIELNAGSRRIDFHCDVDWQEHDRLLKVAFPVDISSLRASYEIQYGHVERSTHDNTSWDVAKFEVPVHKWADLSESDYGVALLNDCKYAADIRGNIMRLTLLKAANAPDPQADRGMHTFSYAILPHAGSLQEGGVIEEAYAFNVPLHVVSASGSGGDLPSEKSFLSVDRPGVFLESLKPAEKSDASVARFYEGYNSRGQIEITSDVLKGDIEAVNFLEKPVEISNIDVSDGKISMKIKPFEIHSIAWK